MDLGRGWEGRVEEQGKRYLDSVSHCGVREKLILGRFPKIHKMTVAKTPSNSGQGAQTGLPCNHINILLD